MRRCEKEQGVIKRILELHSEGLDAVAIGKVLSGAGFDFRGGSWRPATIRNIIRREK